MAGINDFIKERWTVKTVPKVLAGVLPAKGCTISFRLDGARACCMVATGPESNTLSGFKLKNGRLEWQIPDTNKIVVIELEKPAKGGKGAKARPKLKGWLKMGDKTMQGTWGAEAGGGGGGGGGGTGTIYPTGAGADAA